MTYSPRLLVLFASIFAIPLPAAACGNGDAEVLQARTAYSPAAAAAAIAEAEDSCDSHTTRCAPLEDVLAWGADAVPEVLAAFAAHRVGPDHRDTLLGMVVQAHVAGTGTTLIEIADAQHYDSFSARLYAAAADIDGDAVFEQLVHSYRHDVTAGNAQYGLIRLRERTLRWIGEQLPRATEPLALTDLVAQVAVPADKETVAALAKRSSNRIARHRLAARALDLGATGTDLLDEVLASLRSKDAAVRGDAVEYVAASHVPATYAPKFRVALEALIDEPNVRMIVLATELIQLGSQHHRVIETLFDGLASDKEYRRMGSALALARHGHRLDVVLAQDLLNQVDDLLARSDQPDRLKRKLEKAHDVLAARVAAPTT